MKITSIRVRRENLELTRPYTIAYKTVSTVENCIAEVHLQNGIYGLGAANPSKQVVGEDLQDCMAAFLDEHLQDALTGRDIREFRALCEEIHDLLPRNPGAKAALDIALHDAFGQYLGIPVVKLLGERIRTLPTSITIGIKDVAETLEEAYEYEARGFRILKVKLGHSVEEDLERLYKLREQFGDRLGIRVDANQGYTVEDMRQFHRQSEELKLELVEQPLSRAFQTESETLPENIRRTIAADESLVDVGDAWQLAQTKACGIFNIKLMKCGGIYQGLRIAEVARLAGIDLMWGCNDESIISITAALHAAFSCPHTRYIDLDGSLDLARDVVSGGFRLQDGMMSVSYEPGLGFEK